MTCYSAIVLSACDNRLRSENTGIWPTKLAIITAFLDETADYFFPPKFMFLAYLIRYRRSEITHDLLSFNLRIQSVKSMLHAGHGFASAVLQITVSPFLYEACNGLSLPILYHQLYCEQKFHTLGVPSPLCILY